MNIVQLKTSDGASAVKKRGHFEVRKSSSQVTRMHFFPQNKLTTFFSCRSHSKHRPPTPFHRHNKTIKAVRYGNIFIFCSHYYRSKAIRRAKQGGARAWDRAVDLPARSFDLDCSAEDSITSTRQYRAALNVSNFTSILDVCRVRTSFGDRTFAVAGARACTCTVARKGHATLQFTTVTSTKQASSLQY